MVVYVSCIIHYSAVANTMIQVILCYLCPCLSMMDGHLLKPSHPAMSIDSTFLQRAFGSGGPDGQLWAAFTLVCTFHSISIVDIIYPLMIDVTVSTDR